MKKRFKRLFGKKGLTLVEILVVLIVASILLVCAMGMLTPVNNLLNSVKGNAHMDTASNTVNEYIRGTLEKSEAISIIPYSKLSTDVASVRNQWKSYTDKYKATSGYSVRAMGIMENYNGDYRLYDFGDVSSFNYSWGVSMNISPSNDGVNPGNAFVLLMKNRDGGGRGSGGLDGHEFHWFDAFNEEFYSNGALGKTNYSYEVAFESTGATIPVEGGSINGVSYLTVHTQVFKRTGSLYSPNPSEQILKFEPVNQLKSLSFKLLNGNATLDMSGSVNTVVTNANGAKVINLPTDPTGKVTRDGLIILYVVRDMDSYYTMTYPASP